MCNSGERPSGSCRLRSMVFRASMKPAMFSCFGEKVEIASNGLLDVILEHGDDQFVLAGKIRIKGPAREAGRGSDGLDTGAADALFLEDARRRLEQLFAGVVPGWSGPNS